MRFGEDLLQYWCLGKLSVGEPQASNMALMHTF